MFGNKIPFSSDLPTKIAGIKTKETGKGSMEISWDKLNFRICTPTYMFNLVFKNESTFLFENKTRNVFFICDSKCAKATELEIWAVVDGEKWNVTKFNLTKNYEGEFLQNHFCQVVLFILWYCVHYSGKMKKKPTKKKRKL